MSAGVRPANGATAPANRRRAQRAHERRMDALSWRIYLDLSRPTSGWIPGDDEDES